MVYLVLDTNTWLYLANGFNSVTSKYDRSGQHESLLKEFQQLIDRRKIRLYTNEIVIDEWKRNVDVQEHGIKIMENSANEKIRQMEAEKKETTDSAYISVIDEHIKQYQTNVFDNIYKARQHLQNVDALLNSSAIIPIDDSIKVASANLALQKKAPFHHKNNSVGDAVIVLSTSKYFSDQGEYAPNFENVIFVTNNSDDFCEAKGSSVVHPDLVPYFTKGRMKLETNIGRALGLSKNLIQEIDEFNKSMNLVDSCLASCKGGDYYTNLVAYELTKINIDSEVDIDHFNPNQIRINFGSPIDLSKEELLQKEKQKDELDLLSGSCMHCGAFHIECECGEKSYTYDSTDGEIECSCGNVYLIEQKEITLIRP